MKTLKTGTFLLLASFSMVAVQAQTADQIVTKYIDALGGQDVESTASFSDYRKTDFGYTMAFTQKVELP